MKTTEATEVAPQRHDKDTYYLSDYQKVFNEFSKGTLTMMQITVNTSIPTQYICRYVGMFREKELIQIHHLGKCPITGENGVQFLTTNPALFRTIPKQLDIFEEVGVPC